jgi:hypothetical protein
MHDETYRMLGREREADLLREAKKITRAAEVRRVSPPGRRFAGLRARVPVLARVPWPRPGRLQDIDIVH